MSLPADGVNANTLAETTTIPTGKKLIFLDPDTNEGGIITLENLTKQILSSLTSQTFNLDQGNKTLLAALNELNSNSLSDIKNVNWTTNEKKYEIDVSSFAPTNYHYGFLMYGWSGRIELLPFSFSVIPSDTFVNLKENSSVTAVIENNKITFSLIDDTFWGGIRVLLFK